MSGQETASHAQSQHLDAQLGVLGSLLLDADRWAGEVFLRTQEDQYTGEYRTVFQAAQKLHQAGKPIDPVTVMGVLGSDYTQMLLQLMELTPTAENCGAYINLLVEQSQIAKLQALGMALAGCRSPQEGAELVEACNRVFTDKRNLAITTATEGYLDFLARQDTEPQYIPWGFRRLSETVLSSLGDLVVLGGRPSAGKTALSLQMAWEQARNRKVGFFSLETNPEELFDRLNAMAAGVSSTRIRQRTLKDEERKKILDARGAFQERSLEVVNAAGMSVSAIRGVTVARGYQIVYVDYLQIISPERGTKPSDRFGAVSQISMDLHRMAVSLGILVVALSQLSRPERAARNKAPDLFSLRESGQIEQDADAVMLLYKADEDDPASQRRLKVAKNKKGFSGGVLELAFDGSTQVFAEANISRNVQQTLINAGKAAKQRARGNPAEVVELPGKDPDLPF